MNENVEVELTDEERQDRIKEVELALQALAHPGWTVIRNRYQEAYDLQDSLTNIPDERHLYAAQGRLMTLRQFLDLRDHLLVELEWLETDGDGDAGNHYDDFGNEFLDKVED